MNKSFCKHCRGFSNHYSKNHDGGTMRCGLCNKDVGRTKYFSKQIKRANR